MSESVSICIETFNSLFDNRLALRQIQRHTHYPYEILVADNGSTDGSAEWWDAQAAADPTIRVFRRPARGWRCGVSRDFLVKQAQHPFCVSLDSDSFPVDGRWLTDPYRDLADPTAMLVGAKYQRGKNAPYALPSYLVGRTEWLKRHSFVDAWPTYDTAERLSVDAVKEGGGVVLYPLRWETFGGRFKPKAVDYDGKVWHTWWGARARVQPGLAGREFEPDYHAFIQDYLRERFQLDF